MPAVSTQRSSRAPRGRIGRVVFLLLAFAGAAAAWAAEPPVVAVVGAEGREAGWGGTLQATLAELCGAPGRVSVMARDASGRLSFAALPTAAVVVIERGPGPIDAAEGAALKAFLAKGGGCVVLGAAADAWPDSPGFMEEVLGAKAGGKFAGGAPMTVIALYPHPILAGLESFETTQAMPAFSALADDVQMIMEGTVGEETTPLGWVRRRTTGRMCHLVPAGEGMWKDPAYRRMVANAVLWAAGRPIPGALPSVQRTFMPESYPGAFALTLPNGPSVCLDPVRGGINFIWDGDFVDLRPRWLTKQGAPARIFGDVFYREKAWQPLRAGAPNAEPDLDFRGYAWKDGNPEFHYVVGGRDVFETITAAPAGPGIVRRFRVGPGDRPLWLRLESQADADLFIEGIQVDGDTASFASREAGSFKIEIRRRAGGAR